MEWPNTRSRHSLHARSQLNFALHTVKLHSQRSAQKRQPKEVDVKPEWATEAALDGKRMVRDSGSEKGVSIEVIGHSASAGES